MDVVINVFQALSDQLGLPGTPAADILSKLGKPNEMTASLDQGVSIQTMPGKSPDSLCRLSHLFEGPVVPESTAENSGLVPFYFVYNLIPKKLYLFFKVNTYTIIALTNHFGKKIDPVKETVITSDWHNSL